MPDDAISNDHLERLQPHEMHASDVVDALATHPRSGLSSHVAHERLRHYGPNVLAEAPRQPAWLRFILQFRDIQVYLLLAAVAVSLLVWIMEHAHGIPYEAIVIMAIVLLNATFGFVQESRADRALAALSKMTPRESTVVRDGQPQRILSRDLVPGDLLVINEGEHIAADARLVETVAFHTQEATLTGESVPVLKDTEPLEISHVPSDWRNMVFAGTSATSGHARAVVTSTGIHTEFGRIAALLGETREQKTPLQMELDRLGRQLGIAVVAVAVIVVITLVLLEGIHSRKMAVQSLLFGVALAVAATPEGLAAIVTVVLALGVQRMARRGAIVRRLPAVETLGEATIIASDKTGTMTLNEMCVRSIRTASGSTEVSGAGYVPQGSFHLPDGGEIPDILRDEITLILRAAALVNDAALRFSEGAWKIQGDPTEAALLVAAVKAGISLDDLVSQSPRIGEIPFSSERKRMSTLHRLNSRHSPGWIGSHALFTKGAADLLLERCTSEIAAGGPRPLTEQRRREILDASAKMAAAALRTLGIALRPMPQGPPFDPAIDVEQDLMFLGLVGMIDPPRPEARAAVAEAAAAGIRTILITGDHAATALAVARDLGIDTSDGVLTGADLEHMTDDDLAVRLRVSSVFARVDPAHKLRIVRALQANGEIVAMTGDGVNDAPALKAADIGVAMGITGTDVAREAADLVLTDDNFATIVTAIQEGRTIFDNIKKFLRYLLSTNFGEILTLFLGVVLIVLLRGRTNELMLPLLAVQILWINLVTDGAPALALGLDPASADVMCRAPDPANARIIDRSMFVDIGVVASIMAAGTLWVFYQALRDGAIVHGRTMAFTTIVLFQLFNALNARSGTRSIFTGLFSNRWLWATIAASLLLQSVVLNTPLLQHAFGVVALSIGQWAQCAVIASSVVWIVELEKLVRGFIQSRKKAGRASGTF